MKGKVFVGNDCFGRNTYGGGQFDLYKAGNKLKQLNDSSKTDELKVALFAPGFTYEGEG